MSNNPGNSYSSRNMVFGDQVNQGNVYGGIGIQKNSITQPESTQPGTDIRDLAQEITRLTRYVEQKHENKKFSDSQFMQLREELGRISQELHVGNTDEISKSRVKKRLIALVAIATTGGALLATSTEFITNVFTLSEKFGIKREEITLPER